MWSPRRLHQAERSAILQHQPAQREAKTQATTTLFSLLQLLCVIIQQRMEIEVLKDLKHFRKIAISLISSTSRCQCVCSKNIQLFLKCPWLSFPSCICIHFWRVCVCMCVCVCVCAHVVSRNISYTYVFPFGSPCFVFIFLLHNFLHLHSEAATDTRSGVGVHAGSPLPCQVERTHTCLQMRAGSWQGKRNGRWKFNSCGLQAGVRTGNLVDSRASWGMAALAFGGGGGSGPVTCASEVRCTVWFSCLQVQYLF